MKQNVTNNTLKLGPRMSKIVKNRLASTLIQFRYSCAGIAKIEDQLLQYAENPDADYISKVSIDKIIDCLNMYADESQITKKLQQNVMHDIQMKSKHYRTWNNDSLYLTETYVESFDHYRETPVSKTTTRNKEKLAAEV